MQGEGRGSRNSSEHNPIKLRMQKIRIKSIASKQTIKHFGSKDLINQKNHCYDKDFTKMSSSKPVVLGRRGFQAFVNEFRGEPKIHIRKQYSDPVTGQTFPTKCGITLSLEEWNELLSNSNIITEQLHILGRKAEAQNRRNSRDYQYQYSARNESKRYHPYMQRPAETNPRADFRDEMTRDRYYAENQRNDCQYSQGQSFIPIDIKTPDLQDLTSEETVHELLNGPL